MKDTHGINLLQLALFCFIVFLLPLASSARDVTFTWTANPEPITGYRLYYKLGDVSEPPYDGTEIPGYESPVVLDKVTTYTITGLSPNITYQFVLTAYNETGESEYSDTVSILPLPFPGPVINNMSEN
jgi:hypothetical protein